MSISNIKLTPEIIQRLNKLDDALLAAYSEIIHIGITEQEAIHRYARISAIGASTRIENALLTDSEINWLDTVLSSDGKQTAFEQNKNLITNKLSKDRERSIEEVAGCRNMLLMIYDRYNELSPLRENDIRGLHDLLMRPYLQDSPSVGNYKTLSNSVIETNHSTKGTRIVFKTADAGLVTAIAMRELVEWYNAAINSTIWPIVIAAEFTYRFLAIHPFQDGNGRVSRGLFLLNLLQAKNKALSTVARYLAIDRQIEKHKEEYYFVLNSCSKGKYSQNPADYKMEYFLTFMLKMVEQSLLDIEIYRKKFANVQKLSPSALQVLDCFKEFPEIKLSTKKICETTNLPRRTTVNSLNTLLQYSLIQRYGQGAGTKYQLTF
jgi:Fic family protein